MKDKEEATMAKFLVWKVDDEKENKREGGGRGRWGHEGFIFGFVRSFIDHPSGSILC